MKMKTMMGMLILASVLLGLGGCSQRTPDIQESESGGSTASLDTQESESSSAAAETVTEGTQEYRGFILDNVLHSEEYGDIHYNLYVPDSYDASRPYALFFTLPGYEGLYFQGVGENLYSVNFGFERKITYRI